MRQCGKTNHPLLASNCYQRDTGDGQVAFITGQGVPTKYGRHRRELPISAIDALRRYFGNHPKVNADVRGAVVVV